MRTIVQCSHLCRIVAKICVESSHEFRLIRDRKLYNIFRNDIEQSGKGKGAVAMTVTNAAKNYLVILKTDGYSEVSFGGTVDVP